jgi:hypothetical protein
VKSRAYREWRESSAVLNFVVGLGERLFARLNVGAANRVPTASLMCFVGFRGGTLRLAPEQF